MSDFDREAEREKLREKYERDKEKREASERMSELLLQGATMTNQHCPECHSPVFRYEGRHFCPTCEKEITDAEGAGSDGEQAEPETSDADAESETAPESEASTSPDTDGSPESAEESESAEPPRPEHGTPTADDAPAPTGERQPARVQPPARREDESTGREGTTQDTHRRAASRSETGESFRDAEASLRREIGSLTRKAEETRDIGRKRDLLAAAREAAETLQVIRQL